MKQRPLAIAIISWVFILIGTGGILRGLVDFDKDAPWVIGSGAVALAGGALLWRRSNWGRWLILAWLVFHVVLSAYHAVTELVVHLLLTLIIGTFLFLPKASAYFRD